MAVATETRTDEEIQADVLAEQWVIGPYAILFGFTLLVLALRLRQLAYEIAARVDPAAATSS